MTILSYHGKQAIKDKYIAQFDAHMKLNEVVQGVDFKYSRSQFASEIGCPIWLVHLSVVIFNGLKKEEAPQFCMDLLTAVPVGVDLNLIKHRLALKRLERLIEVQNILSDQFTNLSDVFERVIVALNKVKNCYQAEMDGAIDIDWTTAKSAANTAWLAAKSAFVAALKLNRRSAANSVVKSILASSAAEAAVTSAMKSILASSAAEAAVDTVETAVEAVVRSSLASSAAEAAEAAKSAGEAKLKAIDAAVDAARIRAYELERDCLLDTVKSLRKKTL